MSKFYNADSLKLGESINKVSLDPEGYKLRIASATKEAEEAAENISFREIESLSKEAIELSSSISKLQDELYLLVEGANIRFLYYQNEGKLKILRDNIFTAPVEIRPTVQDLYLSMLQRIGGKNIETIKDLQKKIQDKSQELEDNLKIIERYVLSNKEQLHKRKFEGIAVNIYKVLVHLDHSKKLLIKPIPDILSEDNSQIQELAKSIYDKFLSAGAFEDSDKKTTYEDKGSAAFKIYEEKEKVDKEKADKYLKLAQKYLEKPDDNKQEFRTMSIQYKFARFIDIEWFCKENLKDNNLFENSLILAIALRRENIIPDIFAGQSLTFTYNIEFLQKLRGLSPNYKNLDEVKKLDATAIYKIDLDILYSSDKIKPLDMESFRAQAGYKEFERKVFIYKEEKYEAFLKNFQDNLLDIDSGTVKAEDVPREIAKIKVQTKELLLKFNYLEDFIADDAKTRFREKFPNNYDESLSYYLLFLKKIDLNPDIVELSNSLGGDFQKALETKIAEKEGQKEIKEEAK